MAIDDSEFEIWEKYAPILYEFLISRGLGCSSLTVEWLPDREEPPGEDHSIQKLILGTHWTSEPPHCLVLIEVRVPLKDVKVDLQEYDEFESGDIGEIGEIDGKAQKVQQIRHDDVICRARHMPQNMSMIATKTDTGQVFVFDRSRHPMNPPDDAAFNPDLRLKSRILQGAGLSWSPFQEGHLLASGNAGLISLWDSKATPENKSLDPLHVFQVHPSVADVAWHLRHDYIFGSVGDNFLHIWDVRNPAASPIHSVAAHKNSVDCLAFNPFNEWLLATGSSDGTVKLFDIRNIHTPLYTFYPKAEEVFQVGWSPKSETILASSCVTGRLYVWDLSRIGDEQTPEEREDGPPELLFIHGGHTGQIHDFSWNPCDDWAIATVDTTDGLLQIWKMAEHIYKDEDDEPPDDPTADAP